MSAADDHDHFHNHGQLTLVSVLYGASSMWGIEEGHRAIETDLLLSGIGDGIGELVERIAHLRGSDIGRCVLECLGKIIASVIGN